MRTGMQMGMLWTWRKNYNDISITLYNRRLALLITGTAQEPLQAIRWRWDSRVNTRWLLQRF